MLWATEPSLVVAPGATGHKSKFRTLDAHSPAVGVSLSSRGGEDRGRTKTLKAGD